MRDPKDPYGYYARQKLNHAANKTPAKPDQEQQTPTDAEKMGALIRLLDPHGTIIRPRGM